MLVYVRPSNEALPRARVPGAQDQRGCQSHLHLIIGIGLGGGMLTYKLALSRKNILLLERGGYS